MPDPPNTKSNAVAAHLRDLLVAHLEEWLGDEALAAGDYYLGDGRFVKAAQAPCIYLDDQGSSVTGEGSAAGWDPDTQTTTPGFQVDRYRLDLQVFRKGLDSKDMRVELNEWRDSVAACLRKYWSFATYSGEIYLDSSDPAFEFTLKSATFWAAVVRIEADARSWQGSMYLMGDEPV